MRAGGLLQQPEVVPAGAATRHLERVALHPRPRVDGFVVREFRPARHEPLRLLLHHRELRPLVLRRVPGQHHAANPVVVLAVADHREASAPRVLELREEVDLLDRLAELLLVRRDLVEEPWVGDDDEPPLLRRDADRVDVAEPAPVVELAVVVVEDVEVREPLAVRHEPADRIGDLGGTVAARGGELLRPSGPDLSRLAQRPEHRLPLKRDAHSVLDLASQHPVRGCERRGSSAVLKIDPRRDETPLD